MATNDRDAMTGTKSPATPEEKPRKPYEPPQIRMLGTVRELTLGFSVLAKSEGGGTFQKTNT